jgi:hypothetical protein
LPCTSGRKWYPVDNVLQPLSRQSSMREYLKPVTHRQAKSTLYLVLGRWMTGVTPAACNMLGPNFCKSHQNLEEACTKSCASTMPAVDCAKAGAQVCKHLCCRCLSQSKCHIDPDVMCTCLRKCVDLDLGYSISQNFFRQCAESPPSNKSNWSRKAPVCCYFVQNKCEY